MKYSLKLICSLFNVTRQAYYKRQKVKIQRFLEEQVIIGAVRAIRKRQARVGGRKLYHMLHEKGFEIGRDKLFDILRKYKMLVKPKKNYKKTTNSFHRFRKYSNMIKELNITKPNQVFVADITYLSTLEGFCYLVLITDVYSRKIVGWDLSQSLAIEGCQRALKMALAGVPEPQKLTHHSDRGIQFCSHGYIDILNHHEIQISMTEENHVYENAIAERVNGIFKDEFMLGETLRSFQIAKELVKQSIEIYNKERLHTSLNYQTPEYRYRHAA
ncbi:MAG: IS3 family transposase [bacterium]